MVNKMLYLIIAVFLGAFGVHKFYAGKIGMGIIYLVLSATGLSCVFTIFDIIIGILMPSDVNGNMYI